MINKNKVIPREDHLNDIQQLLEIKKKCSHVETYPNYTKSKQTNPTPQYEYRNNSVWDGQIDQEAICATGGNTAHERSLVCQV